MYQTQSNLVSRECGVTRAAVRIGSAFANWPVCSCSFAALWGTIDVGRACGLCNVSEATPRSFALRLWQRQLRESS
jgi:hypothetical protein